MNQRSATMSSTDVHSRKNGLIDAMVTHPTLVWNKKVPNTEMEKLQRIIEEKYNLHFESYWEFHGWSVKNYVDFWKEMWHYFGIISSKPYDQVLVKTGNGFLDNDWFSGARLNFAENILRIRNNRIALICMDEDGNEETVTFAEMFEETIKNGLSHIRNSCLLEKFLEIGKNPDGTVPNLIFEQLPFNHPLVINFTSGTTGLPKGPVHSIGSFLADFRTLSFNYNLKEGDTIYTLYPVGWVFWEYSIPALGLGVKLFLHVGSPLMRLNGANIWDIFAQHKITSITISTNTVEKMNKENILPKPGVDLDSLKIIAIGGSPVKKHHVEYFKKVKEDVFVAPGYAATEIFGAFAGFDLNTPCYAEEITVPLLGVDIKCFDHQGKSVIGQRGELVVSVPCPGFPIYLWKDMNNKILHSTYLSKYEGVWCQNDECWINPKTNGLIVIGRSDDTLKQNSERFGSEDIYFAIQEMEELQDYICVGQENDQGDTRAVLFVKMKNGYTFTPALKDKIGYIIGKEFYLDYVPKVIIQVPDIPYNQNNKRMESVVRRIITTNEVPDVMNIRNPECLQYFCNIPQLMNY